MVDGMWSPVGANRAVVRPEWRRAANFSNGGRAPRSGERLHAAVSASPAFAYAPVRHAPLAGVVQEAALHDGAAAGGGSR
jgi:hypothetical protein